MNKFSFFPLMPCNLQTKVPGVKSVISKASNSKADVLIEAGDKIHIGDLFLEVGLLLPFDLYFGLLFSNCITLMIVVHMRLT